MAGAENQNSAKTYSIKLGALESIIIAARNVYPDEFISMLGGKNRVIEELVILPADFGDDFSSIRLDLAPFDKTIIGTVHSHPTHSNSPSRADLEVFRMAGEVHIIIGYPYDLNTARAFDNKGKTLRLKVVE